MKRLVAVAGAVAIATAVVSAPTAAVAQPPAPLTKLSNLTNLAHLDFLTTSVTPPAQARHTTYDLGAHPSIGALWVYATHNDDGSYTRVGGGDFDSTTGTYTQGAFDADDIARAAVVYVRHWRQFHDSHSRAEAYALLRGLTYLQTATGADRGNVVLWMQPDGTLNPSARPKEEPDPSDSANSYWLARTIWALGEGYQAFAGRPGKDVGFAKFLRARMDLAIGALRRDSLSRYGDFQRADGARTPKWLIVGGADASAEAVLGLAAFVRAGGREARPALRKLAVGIADLGTPSGANWPYGAILPSATSRSTWHAWASLTPAALSVASTALHRPKLAAPAIADSTGFSPKVFTRYGPLNGLTPAPTDTSQIAYGVDSRVQSLLATAKITHSAKLRRLAGVYAGWFFGQNYAGAPMYNPATGVTYDGISAENMVNENSGAESTIHGLLTMMALDAAPAVARIARASKQLEVRTGTITYEAEYARTTGAASPADANPAGTAESAWSGGRYLNVTGGATAKWRVAPSGRARIVEAIIDRVPGRAAHARFAHLGSVAFGGGGRKGASAVPGRLVPVVIGILPAGATTIRARFSGGAARLDALLLTPVITVVRTGHVAVISNNTAHARTAKVPGFPSVRVAANGFRVVRSQ